MKTIKRNKILTLFFGMFCLISCENSDETSPESNGIIFNDKDFTVDDWSQESHGKLTTPNFSEVFPNDEVKRIDIIINSDRWDLMLSDMKSLHGEPGQGGGPPGGGPPGGGPPGGLDDSEDPMWVPGDIIYNGKKWYRAGVRFKGNSSLVSTWSRGLLKLSFKLDFDEFEDEYPQIDNQRFYGFKQLSLKNNFEDRSFLREKVAGEIFYEAGLVSAHTSFCEVYVDHGEGSQYFGLYTIVEEMDDTVIKNQFSESNGNLYKPEGAGASFRKGSFNKDHFTKDTNEDDSDWTDIENLFTVLHSELRTNSPSDWQAKLDSIFDTQNFLKYLAYNTVLQNWDTYGRMTHNYFLYNNPETKKLTWIPWDNNEALQTGKQGGALNLNFSNLSKNGQWPLIEYLYDNDYYKSIYDAFVEESVNGSFNYDILISKYDNYSQLINESIFKEENGYTFLNSTSDFQSAISSLKNHALQRKNAVKNYVSN